MLTIDPGGPYYAILDDDPSGVSVAVIRRGGGFMNCNGPDRRVDVWLLESCWHVACDQVHELLLTLDAAEKERVK